MRTMLIKPARQVSVVSNRENKKMEEEQKQMKELMLAAIGELENVDDRPPSITFTTVYPEKPSWQVAITFTQLN